MPRQLDSAIKSQIYKYMFSGVSQRDIHRLTGADRNTIRKMAREIGFQFPRKGIEIKGNLCVCDHCKNMFYRNKYAIDHASKHYCSTSCKRWDMRGPDHPSWKDGETARNFSSWVYNQLEYKEWRNEVLKKYGNRCAISGRTYDLEAHHIMQKAEGFSPESAFDVENGICLNKEVHTRLHQLVKQGYDPEQVTNKLFQEFDNGINRIRRKADNETFTVYRVADSEKASFFVGL